MSYSNSYEHIVCKECRRYLLSSWGRPNIPFRCFYRNDAKYLCVDCDPMGCNHCGLYLDDEFCECPDNEVEVIA